MDAIEFVNRYPSYIAQLEKVVKPEFQDAIKKLKELDPNNIVELNTTSTAGPRQ